MWIKICEKKTEHYNRKEKAWVYTRYLLKRQWTELHTKQHTWRWWNNKKKGSRPLHPAPYIQPCDLITFIFHCCCSFFLCLLLFFFVYVWENCKEKTFWYPRVFFVFHALQGQTRKRWRLKKTGSFICASLSLTDLSTDDCFLICFPLWVWK